MVLRHAFFSGAAARLPPGHVLVHLAHLYVVRSCELWKTEEVRCSMRPTKQSGGLSRG